MKTKRPNRKQVETNIANIIRGNRKKIEQLEMVKEISSHLTSDDGIRIICELYTGNIARYLITGTRCSMTVTANTITGEIIRKPRGTKPWYSDWVTTNATDILRKV